jgi:hypothetical protein
LTKKEILLFFATWVESENIILSKISQAQKDKYHVFSFICRISNNLIQEESVMVLIQAGVEKMERAHNLKKNVVF